MQMVQQAEGHHRPALRMVDAVDQVANVVEVGRDLDQLHLPRGVPQRLQNILAVGRHQSHVGKAVLGKAPDQQGLVGLGDIGADLL